MSDLLDLVIESHGGLDRWNRLTEITAHVAVGGMLWERKGHGGILADTHVALDPHRQRLGYRPFGALGRRSVFEALRTAIEDDAGVVLAERDDQRAAFAGHRPETCCVATTTRRTRPTRRSRPARRLDLHADRRFGLGPGDVTDVARERPHVALGIDGPVGAVAVELV